MIDDGLYFESACALRDGKGYTLPSRPGQPYAAKYPIGLPVLTAVALHLIPATTPQARYGVARALMILSGWGFAIACFVFVRRLCFSVWLAVLVPLAILLHPATLQLSIALMSDIPFLALSFCLLARWAGSLGKRENSAFAYFLDGLITGCAILIRGNGVTLACAGVCYILIRPSDGGRAYLKRLRELGMYVAGIFLVCLPALAYRLSFNGPKDSGNYANEWRAAYAHWPLAMIAGRNAFLAIQVFAELIVAQLAWSTPGGKFMSSPARAAIIASPALALMTIGAFAFLRSGDRKQLPVWVHAALTTVLFLLWPWDLNQRFVLSALPLVLILLGSGLECIGRGISGPSGKSLICWPAAASIFFSAIVLGGVLLRASRSHWIWGGIPSGQMATLSYAKTHLEWNAVIISILPETCFVYSGHQAVPVIEDDDKLIGRYGRWDRLSIWLDRCNARPVYFVGSDPSDPNQEVEAHQVRALLTEPQAPSVREVFRSSDGQWWVARLLR